MKHLDEVDMGIKLWSLFLDWMSGLLCGLDSNDRAAYHERAATKAPDKVRECSRIVSALKTVILESLNKQIARKCLFKSATSRFSRVKSLIYSSNSREFFWWSENSARRLHVLISFCIGPKVLAIAFFMLNQSLNELPPFWTVIGQSKAFLLTTKTWSRLGVLRRWYCSTAVPTRPQTPIP